MGTRHDSIGIKQVIPYEWMRKVASLVLAGLPPKEIRQELHAALILEGKQVQSGERSAWTRTFLVNNLMAIWSSPDSELSAFREIALDLLRAYPDQAVVIHWAMISATYPFWFNTARQTGRLLNLQTQVTQTQIVGRLKEQYGDRQTVSRYARFVIRSFVDWHALTDGTTTGRYEKTNGLTIADHEVAVLLLHAALLASPEAKAPLRVLLSSPAFFPFHLTPIRGETFLDRAGNLKLVRYGLDDELLMITR
ncbi:hypothetical protein [Agrobacterium rosae]|uniref:DUF1819 domain-containing protein n=1 Tax=Agrobacterium rosae TaxID=1972867 RepID=A0A1R3U274_9HYPH|nr:hypothetical protein [Agrobacterium rosae]SCX35208.1 hypothetical protein DSM25559_4853 [Agrobacterium rosae]